ncbi:hypothetical protein, unknown function [Leishmania infantum JPCM5]|uniref:Uncharacterized protein n=2 Tax=Leishmania infantum TaxID=5671 RepID=A4HWW1_LEIIN|nr:hypothetical protein, unknown function [Leishmania infantum JPCM5]CAC9474945.1 hypothetical_protein_-_conserved [Leishmania infantum]CAM66943.1 hypothetical protein, unknown function [Leishmania infantum JPCM5]SUZ40642.1 hypothetical_protein_-_conserved [Leishmania infantum]|eukprot:XP_001464552.1 hypothetical protein, unknown function [Leishmania infantum JPCM5]
MSGRRVADTAVTNSGELVESLLHVFHPLLLCVADALTNATAVTPPQVVARVGVADGGPQGIISLWPEGETDAKTAAAPTPNTQDATGAQLRTATASSMVSEGAAGAFSPVAPAPARDSSPSPADTTAVFCAAEEDEAGGHDDEGGSNRKAAQQRLPTALVQDELSATQGASDAEHLDGGNGVDSDAAKAVTAALRCPAQKESVVACPSSSTSSLPHSTSPPSTYVPADSDEASATTPRKRGRPPLSRTVTARLSKKEDAAKTPEEPLPRVATPPPHAARPFCFTMSNAVLWEAVAALAEAVLIGGACFSWLQGEVQRRADAEQQHGEGQRGSKTASSLSLPSPARVLADALLGFGSPSVTAAHMRWRERAVASKDGASPTGNGSHEPSAQRSGESGVFAALPAGVQDAVFTAVSAALMRAAAVHTAQLLSPLCAATPGDSRLTQKGGETVGQQQDVPAPPQHHGNSPSFAAPPRAAACAAPVDHSSAASLHLQTNFGCRAVPAPSFHWQQWAERGLAAEAQGLTNAAGAPLTFRMVQETVKHQNRRTLQAQQLQQPRPAAMSATLSRSPASVFPASAAAVVPGSSGTRGDAFVATATTGAPSATAAAGQPPSRTAESPLSVLMRQAEAQDHSCFYVQVSTGDRDGATRIEATAAPTGNTAVRASEFTVQVLCSALASVMTDEAAAATLQDSATTEATHFVDDAAADSGDVTVCACEAKHAQNGEGRNLHRLAGDAGCGLVRQWCAGLEQLACITSSVPTWCSASRRRRHSSCAVSAAALFAYLRDSSVNPPLELLADYALETGKATSAPPRAPHPAARDIHGGHAATAGAAAATVGTAVRQSPWTTARWSVRPVLGMEEVDYAADQFARSGEHHRAHAQGVTALPSLPTDSAADAYPPNRSAPSALIDAGSPQGGPSKQPKTHAGQVASASPRWPPAVEWLRLSDEHGHPSQSDQAEDTHSAPPSLQQSTTRVVERSTAALFQRVLAPMIAGEQGDARISADVVNPLEEVGTVLATLDAACAGRTLVDTTAWRYGRNRMNVAAVSIIGLTVPDNDKGGSAGQRNDDVGKDGASHDSTHNSPRGPSAERAALQSTEEGASTAPVSACRARVPLGLYHHECGVLHVVDGATYALEVD